MQILAWDQVFIRCRRATVNRLVSDVPGWDRWWPGSAVRTLTVADHLVSLDGRLPRSRQRLVVHVDRVRPRDKGLEFSVRGDVVGTGEWFHLDEPAGVVVHYLLRGDARRLHPRMWVATHRWSVRRGMWGLKRRLEAGRVPGAEPHPQLVAHQRRELAILAREADGAER